MRDGFCRNQKIAEKGLEEPEAEGAVQRIFAGEFRYGEYHSSSEITMYLTYIPIYINMHSSLDQSTEEH